MDRSRKKLLWLAFGVFFVWWFAVPKYRQWQADKLVDQLCAKDGGFKVFETVTMPASYFNEWGQPRVDHRKEPTKSEYYFDHQYENILGDMDSDQNLVVFRATSRLISRSDTKILGVSKVYIRRGGDPNIGAEPS